jgi:small conductance mechanosensitive channel
VRGASRRIRRTGNIHYAYVYLDGRPLIEVTAEVPSSVATGGVLPIRSRIETIQNSLYQIIETGFDPDSTQVFSAVLNNQQVLIASSQDQRQVILTITDLDAQFSGLTPVELSRIWKEKLEAGLQKAWRERRLSYILQQLGRTGLIAASAALSSLILAQLQKHLLAQRAAESQKNIQYQSATADDQDDQEGTTTNQREKRDRLLAYLEDQITRKLPQLPQNRWFNLTLLLRRCLQWGQVITWLAALISILLLYPYFRGLGIWLLGIPIRMLLAWLGMTILNRLVIAIIDYFIWDWLDSKPLDAPGYQRYEFRARTYYMITRSLVQVVSVPLFIFLVLYILNVPITSLLTGAGLVGVIVSFGAQGLVRDVLNGIWILVEDQYAVGDWVVLEGVTGAVEFMNIRITQLRDFDGYLVSLPNGQIHKVQNMTNRWARMNLTVTVAYDTDINEALAIFRQVSLDLAHDPAWQDLILEPLELLGVEDLSHEGILIRNWMRTQPGWHWAVSREYLQRLKSAFDQKGIQIGIPQQSIPQLSFPSSSGQYPYPSARIRPHSDPVP